LKTFHYIKIGIFLINHQTILVFSRLLNLQPL